MGGVINMVLFRIILVLAFCLSSVGVCEFEDVKFLELRENSTEEQIKDRKWEIYKFINKYIKNEKLKIIDGAYDLTMTYSYKLYEQSLLEHFMKVKYKAMVDVQSVNSFISELETYVVFDEDYWVQMCIKSGKYVQGVVKVSGKDSGWYRC